MSTSLDRLATASEATAFTETAWSLNPDKAANTESTSEVESTGVLPSKSANKGPDTSARSSSASISRIDFWPASAASAITASAFSRSSMYPETGSIRSAKVNL